MSQILPALKFLRKDIDIAHEQWVGTRQFMSLLQREDKNLSELLELFDPSEDIADWETEYAKPDQKAPKLQQLRKRIAYLMASRKEFYEDYDTERTDVDFIRLLEVPYTDSKYVIDWSMTEMGD